MTRFDTWLGTDNGLRTWYGDKSRAASVGNIILDKSASITIERELNGVVSTISAQTVRIDTISNAREAGYMFDTGLVSSQTLVLLGYKNHATVTDSNILTGDRFVLDGRKYEVTKVESSFTDRLLAFIVERQ